MALYLHQSHCLSLHLLPLESLVAMELAPASSATEITATTTPRRKAAAAAADLLFIVVSGGRRGRDTDRERERATEIGAPRFYTRERPLSLSLSLADGRGRPKALSRSTVGRSPLEKSFRLSSPSRICDISGSEALKLLKVGIIIVRGLQIRYYLFQLWPPLSPYVLGQR